MLRLQRKGDVVYRLYAMPDGSTCHEFLWSADSAGDCIYCGFQISGEAVYVDYTQTDGNNTGTWTWTLQNDLSADALEGLMSSVTVHTSARKVLSQTYTQTSTFSRGLPLAGKYAFVVDCSDASARSGTFRLTTRPGPIAAPAHY